MTFIFSESGSSLWLTQNEYRETYLTQDSYKILLIDEGDPIQVRRQRTEKVFKDTPYRKRFQLRKEGNTGIEDEKKISIQCPEVLFIRGTKQLRDAGVDHVSLGDGIRNWILILDDHFSRDPTLTNSAPHIRPRGEIKTGDWRMPRSWNFLSSIWEDNGLRPSLSSNTKQPNRISQFRNEENVEVEFASVSSK